jgi:hypothetical protein
MDLHYSIKDLNLIEAQVKMSVETLKANGTIIGTQHYLSIIQNLIEENRALRDELIERYSSEHKVL